MPGAVSALAELGVDPPGAELCGIRYVDGDRAVDAAFRDGPGRGVRRTTLHAALCSALDAQGLEVEQHGAREVAQDGEGVVVDGVRFRHVVAADGLHSPLRRSLGLDGRPAGRRRFGLRRHFRATPWTSYVEVHWARGLEAYVTPVADDLVGVAFLTSAHRDFDECARAFPDLVARLGDPADDVRGAGPLHQRARARVAGRVLLVGDAGGYVDALTGEGVALAVAQARAAVGAIVAGEPERYERDWHAVTRRYRWLTGSLLAATQVPPVRRLLVPSAARLPRAFSGAVNALAAPA